MANFDQGSRVVSALVRSLKWVISGKVLFSLLIFVNIAYFGSKLFFLSFERILQASQFQDELIRLSTQVDGLSEDISQLTQGFGGLFSLHFEQPLAELSEEVGSCEDVVRSFHNSHAGDGVELFETETSFATGAVNSSGFHHYIVMSCSSSSLFGVIIGRDEAYNESLWNSLKFSADPSRQIIEPIIIIEEETGIRRLFRR